MPHPSPAYRVIRAVWRKVKLARLAGTLARDGLYDLIRYWRWSHGTDGDRTRMQATHALYKAYHGVEKGLSMAEPRPGFGRDKIAALQFRLDDYARRFEGDGMPPAVSALHSYRRFNAAHGISSVPLDVLLDASPDDGSGGTRTVTRDEIAAATSAVTPDFFWSRHSIRNFSSDPVEMDLIFQAIDMARKTPTVCNRQGPRVHVFERARDALDWQPGNRGFGHLASRALVVTTDLQAFSGRGERNQAFIDGGMFAMSLLYALHALKLGACPLAWSMPAPADRKMRHALSVPDSEVVIMMIAVGHLPSQFEVAQSHRMPIDRFVQIHAETPGNRD